MKISIITAVYNNKSHLADAISSVNQQRAVLSPEDELEYIVVDGGSSDGTLDVIRKNETQLSQWISEPDHGIYDALNKGLHLATGDIIGFLHSDDVYPSDDVLKQVSDIIRRTGSDGVYGDLRYVARENPDRVLRHWSSGEYKPRALKRGWMPPHPTLFLRKEVYREFGNFDTSFRIAADYDFMMRVLSSGTIRIEYLTKVLVHMRYGGASNQSIKNIIRKSLEDLRVMRRYKIGGIGNLISKNLRKLPQFFGR